jgi:hypothetical protein
MPRLIKISLVAQSLIFALCFGVYWLTECRPDSGLADIPEDLLYYLTWLPSMWDGIPGQFLTYLLLGIFSLVALVLSVRGFRRYWAVTAFNLFSLLWSLFPLLNLHIGDYRGP